MHGKEIARLDKIPPSFFSFCAITRVSPYFLKTAFHHLANFKCTSIVCTPHAHTDSIQPGWHRPPRVFALPRCPSSHSSVSSLEILRHCPLPGSMQLAATRQQRINTTAKRQQHCNVRAASIKPAFATSPDTRNTSYSAGAGAQLTEAYDALASLVTPPGDPSAHVLTAGPTPLGRGLIARQCVDRGAPLLAVESWNVLCVSDEPEGKAGGTYGKQSLEEWEAVHGPLPPLLQQYILSGSGWFTRLVAWLLHVSRHSGGIWPLYRTLLPGGHESLMNFLPEERRELQNKELEALAKKERDAILGLHQSVFSDDSGDLRALRLSARFEDTLWAASMVNSRCFADEVSGEAISLVVPCADMANHSTSPNASYRLNTEIGCFQLIAERDVAAGEEVCISYLGTQPTKSNDQMLKDHGFIIPGNAKDRLAFSRGDDIQSRVLGLQPVHQVLDAREITAAAGGQARLEGEESQRLLAVLRSLQPFLIPNARQAGPGQTAAAAAAKTAHLEGEELLALRRQAVGALLDQCAAMRATHSTTMETDEQLLSGAEGPLNPRVRAAITARLERKRLLATAERLLKAYSTMLA